MYFIVSTANTTNHFLLTLFLILRILPLSSSSSPPPALRLTRAFAWCVARCDRAYFKLRLLRNNNGRMITATSPEEVGEEEKEDKEEEKEEDGARYGTCLA